MARMSGRTNAVGSGIDAMTRSEEEVRGAGAEKASEVGGLRQGEGRPRAGGTYATSDGAQAGGRVLRNARRPRPRVNRAPRIAPADARVAGSDPPPWRRPQLRA